MIHIDGSSGEGGGQILRTSLSLAAITGQEVTIDNIRARRDKPGLRPQHLTAVHAVAEICDAEVTDAEVGASRLTFRPRRVRAGSYVFDVSRITSSAGSAPMVLQAVLWPLAFADKTSRVVLRGGTHVPHAPSFNYIDDTFLPTVARMGLVCQCQMVKAGYYPIGGGEIRLEVRPVDELVPFHFRQREGSSSVELTSAVSNLPLSIAERQLETALSRLREMGVECESGIRQYPSPGKGTVVFISAGGGNAKAGFQSLGELRKRAEKVADEACDEFHHWQRSAMALDKHLSDQLIIPMALAKGNSAFTTCEITQHLLTNIAVVERFMGVHFHISRALGEPGTVERVTE